MLSRDAARARLDSYLAPGPDRVRGVRTHGLLPPRLASSIAAAITEQSRPWHPLAQQLDDLDLAGREKVLGSLAPALGRDLARWWDWSAGQPYQRGWQRRAYRSPERADSLAARWQELRWLLHHASQYPHPLMWHAEWASHLGHVPPLGPLLASAIAHGATDVAEVVTASLRGEHDISGPSQVTYVALLAAPEPAGWSEVEQLLVAAQRAEGVRQTVLEAADLAHPDAFARVLDVVAEHRLSRFASTVRALGVWIGEDLTVRQEKEVEAAVAVLRQHLRTPPRPESLVGATPEEAFLGTWTLAVRDVRWAVEASEGLLDSPDERTRLAGARMLTDLAVPATTPGLARAVADTSPAVYAAAVTGWSARVNPVERTPVPMTEAVRAVLLRRVEELGPVVEVGTGIVGSLPRKIGSTLAADVLVCHSGDRSLDPALVAASSPDGRLVAARRYAEDPERNRTVLLSLLSDRAGTVRGVVAGALQALPAITDDEARVLEEALTRKASDLRSTAVTLLQRQQPTALAATVARLSAGTAEQRRAAAELGEAEQPDATRRPAVPATLWFSVGDRTPAVRPQAPPPGTWTPYQDGFRLAWTSLSAWLAEHADVEVQTADGVQLLANVLWLHVGKDGALPLPEVIAPWWDRVGPQLTDGGVELALLMHLRRDAPGPRDAPGWAKRLMRTVLGPVASELPGDDVPVLQWRVFDAIALHARRASWSTPLLDLLDTVAAALPLDELRGPPEVLARRGRRLERDQWGRVVNRDPRLDFSRLFSGSADFLDPGTLSDEELARLWQAVRFVDEPEGTLDRWDGPSVEVEARIAPGRSGGPVLVPDQPDRWPPRARILVEAFRRGAATRADLLDALVATPRIDGWYAYAPWHDALRVLTGLRPEPWAAHEDVQRVVEEVREAVVAAEVARGDLPSALSETAHNLRTTNGAHQLVSCVAALDGRPFARAYAWTPSRESSLSHLVRVNQPLPGDSAETLGRLAERAGISTQRLVETAVYAPQWARIVEEHLRWPRFESAVWWMHAHTKDDSWSVDAEVSAQWASEVSQRTPLEATELVAGAADVAWFQTVVAELGEDRFDQVLRASKYASSSGGHKRAELFAGALLGRLDEATVIARVRDKRHQDSVRALGLLPLRDEQALLDRYQLLRGFVASDRTSGSQRRASEATAVEVGLENLARTAGFRDPQRLVWAMEAEAVRDLAAGPVTATDGDLVATLGLDASGAPELTVARAGKPLKSVPARSAKVPGIAALRDRATALRGQVRRMRASLERACVLGDAFEPQELADLLGHPVLAPMLRDLVLVDDEGVVGFPAGGGLVAADGAARPAIGRLRVAHPVDLLASQEWPELQHSVMAGARRQPFKQLFRELYTLNANERDERGVSSRRYAGHQIEGRRAAGLFTSRGWVADVEQGFSRTFHQQRLTVWCHLLDGWGSPTEVEDVTVGDVTFHPAGAWQPLPLAHIPARVFSEAMRDLDLVVSVAHASGVDPEASESSVAVRGRLVDETASLLGLANVEIGGHHARVKGKLGTYSVHLGSGVVHRMPGNAMCIVPVSAQHRGRVFLPFADDDPRTAEVIAKVVLLARDHTIKDPTILQQIVG